MAFRPTDFTRLESTWRPPPIRPDLASIEAHFRDAVGSEPGPIRDPHHFGDRPIPPGELKPASVLIPIIPGDMHLLLTTRPSHMRAHPGQNCFPGGSLEAEDSGPLEAALRETEEEIGLAPEQIRVLGRLGPFCTNTGYRITPFVGVVEGEYELTISEDEVDAVIYIPLHHVTDSASYERRRPGGRADAWYYCLNYGEHYVGGPTVAIMMGFYEELLKSHSTRGEMP